ncbi:MAG: hypothetical protein ABSA79_08010 [Candidatus Bathyarchaeia archaeon]
MEKSKSPFREGNYTRIVRVYGLLHLKECGNISPQCREGGNSYCGLYKKRSRQKR